MNRMTLVLVHGAGRGAWCWERLTPLLDAAGVAWEAPTLTGLADRAHLLGPEVGLSTHVRDVCEILEKPGVAPACLVGHSYGAVVVAGVIGVMPQAVGRVVLLDGPVTEDGECGADVHPRGDTLRARAVRRGDTDVIPIGGVSDPRFSPEDQEWIAGRVTPQPLRCVTEPVRLPGGWPPELPKDVVLCTQPGKAPDRPHLSRIRREAGWSMHTVDSPHDVMIARPDWLADLLIRLSATPTDDSRRARP